MDSFAQLRQEAETRETIRNYRRKHPPVDISRLNEVKDVFGAKHPGEIGMWRTVWDDFNIDYDKGIPEAYLPEAVKGALGLTDKRAIDAVSIGKEFDLLLEADPVDSVELEYGDNEDDTILRLVGPQERPDLYCEDVEQYADREKWAELWANYELEEGITPNINQLTNFCLNLFSVSSDNEAKAAIRVGVMSECILQKEEGFILSSERPEKYWISIWEENNTELEDPLAKQNVAISIAGTEDISTGEANDILADAVDRGELYNPEDADDDQLAINDPSSEEGPEIERKIGIGTDDDDPDDDSDQSDTAQSDGDSPDSTANSGSEETETTPSENGTAPGSDSNSSDGQTASVDDSDTGGDSSTDNSDTDATEDDDTPIPAVEIEDFDVEQKSVEELLAENDDMRELEASIEAHPPVGFRVRKAMAAAIEFFHDHLDETIPENVEWNENNPDAGYRKPETPREYFRDPQYDDDPAAAYNINTRPDIAASKDGPSEYNLSPKANSRLTQDTTSNESSSNNTGADETTDREAATVIPYNLETRDNRGWSPETIKRKKLGWAPRDMDSLREHLYEEGFNDREMLATGLFNLTDNGKLLPFIQARYTLPYFDNEGKPVFLISRSIDTDIPGGRDGEGPDFHSESKYTKPKESHLEEPIYGTETIKEGQPLVITEGIADAITAHEHGIPCISPVTKKFKDKHFPILEDLILENNIPRVFIMQDADPPSTSVLETYTPEYADEYDPETDNANNPPQEVSKDGSDLHKAITVKQKGPGFEGALRTAQYLDAVARRAASHEPTDERDQQGLPPSKWDSDESDGSENYSGDSPGDVEPAAAPNATPTRSFETYLIELPRFGGVKYDLDDYLSDGMTQIAPPAMWVSHILNSADSTDEPVWIDDLDYSGAIKWPDVRCYSETPASRYYSPPLSEQRDDDDDKGTIHPIRPAIGYQPNPPEKTGLPVRATVLNFLPTIGPNSGMLSPAVNESSSSVSPDNLDGIPDNFNSASSNDMFSLKFRDVTGRDEGFRGKSPFGHYGESEDYFCVISEEIAYCHKREVAYTPGTAVLVAEGERRADDPGGSFSPKEKFVYWRHLKQKGILDAKIPKDALIYYALEHGVATRDELVEREGKYGTFETLPLGKKRDTLAKIGDDHGFDITWENYDSAVTKPDTNTDSGTPTADEKPRNGESDSGGSAESSSEQSGGSGEQSSAGESGSDESATSSASGGESSDDTSQSTGVKIGGDTSDSSAGNEGDQSTGEDDDEEIPNTTTNDAGMDTDFLAEQVDNFDDPTATDAEQEGSNDGDDAGTTKFHTYEEPDLSNPSIDVDIDAMAQFIEHHATTEDADGEALKTRTDTMLHAFSEWSEMNEIELDELDPELPESNRKGNLTQILEGAFDIEKDRRRLDGDRPYVYHPISLEDNILNII